MIYKLHLICIINHIIYQSSCMSHIFIIAYNMYYNVCAGERMCVWWCYIIYMSLCFSCRYVVVVVIIIVAVVSVVVITIVCVVVDMFICNNDITTSLITVGDPTYCFYHNTVSMHACILFIYSMYALEWQHRIQLMMYDVITHTSYNETYTLTYHIRK